MNDNANPTLEELPVPLDAVEQALGPDPARIGHDRGVGPWPFLAQPGTPIAEGNTDAAAGLRSTTEPDIA